MRFLLNPSFACLVLFLTVTFASPFPTEGDGKELSEKAKGKQKEVSDPTPDPQGEPPLPGRSGVHTDPNGDSWASYGDDDLPEHMRHTDRNHELHPETVGAFGLAPDPKANRDEALRGVDRAPAHKVTKWPQVKDEKTPAMLDNPTHKDSTTVEYRSGIESGNAAWTTDFEGQPRTYQRPPGFRTEGSLTGELSRTMKAREGEGLPAKGGIRTNPGWLPLPPSAEMGRAHEADDTQLLGMKNEKDPAKVAEKARLAALDNKKAPKSQASKAGLAPKEKEQVPLTEQTLKLRTRPQGQPVGSAPKKDPAPSRKGPVRPSNLQPGTPPRPGPKPVPKPGDAPGPDGKPKPEPWMTGESPLNPEARVPPRPQDRSSGPQVYKPAPKPPKKLEEAPQKKPKALEEGDNSRTDPKILFPGPGKTSPHAQAPPLGPNRASTPTTGGSGSGSGSGSHNPSLPIRPGSPPTPQTPRKQEAPPIAPGAPRKGQTANQASSSGSGSTRPLPPLALGQHPPAPPQTPLRPQTGPLVPPNAPPRVRPTDSRAATSSSGSGARIPPPALGPTPPAPPQTPPRPATPPAAAKKPPPPPPKKIGRRAQMLREWDWDGQRGGRVGSGVQRRGAGNGRWVYVY